MTPDMLPSVLFLAFIIFQRLAELVLAKRNTQRLIQKGAVEIGAGHYPAMVIMHTVWVVALVWFGAGNPVSLFWLVLFAILQMFRIWILTSLGSRWTTRIIVLDEPLVIKGPYRYFKHPNYILVVAEIFVAPMVLGVLWLAVVFSILNAVMLYVRIGAEENALKQMRKP